MDLQAALRLARRWWWFVVAATLVGGAAAYGVSSLLTPVYSATTKLLVVQRPSEGVVQLNDLQTAERLANTFSQLVTLRPVLERAIRDGNLPFDPQELEGRLRVTNPRDTQLLELSARSSNPELAAYLANTVAQAFISSNEAALTSRPGQVSVVEEAIPPDHPISPSKLLNAALGAMLLGLIGIGVVLVIEHLDDTVRTAEQAAEVSGLTVLGRIAQFEHLESPREQLLAATQPRSTIAEAFRAARTNLSYSIDLGRERRLILVTSPGLGDGKTTAVANLAVVFGLAGHRVCVVDTDLRRPTLHRLFGVDNAEGVTNLLLARDLDIEHAIQRTLYTNVSALTSGPLPPNPSELLGSSRMQEVLDAVKERFDVVLLDSPPALAVTDASVLATLVDGLVLVACAGRTHAGELHAAVEELAQSGRPIAGVLMNRVRARDAGYYRHAYRQTYAEDLLDVPDRPRLRAEDLVSNGSSAGKHAEPPTDIEPPPGRDDELPRTLTPPVARRED